MKGQVNFKTNGLSSKIKKLKSIPIIGSIMNSGLSWMLINDIKIVAGSDIFRIKLFIPNLSDFPSNFFLGQHLKELEEKDNNL